jgi:hypothetical protein
MFAKPQAQHQWLDQLIGDWNIEHQCQMPDGSISMTHGKMTCRTLGGMWLISESEGVSPEGESWSSILTVGFDPVLGRYVGTFVGSMMPNIWYYQGQLDESQSGCRWRAKVPVSTAWAQASTAIRSRSSMRIAGCSPASSSTRKASGSSSSMG